MIPVPELHRIAQTYGMPEFVKQSELQYDESSLRRQQWADPDTKQYPIHTKSACFISNVQFWESGIIDEDAEVDVGEALIKAAKYWGIMPEVKTHVLEKVAKETVFNTVNDMPDEWFALVDNDAGIKLYPMPDSATTKIAAEQLYEDRHNLPYEWRHKAADRIYEKVAEHNLELDDDVADYLERAAGRGLTSTKSLVNLMNKRAALLRANKKTPEAEALNKAAAAMSKLPSSRQLSEKVASVVAQVDEETDLFRYYGTELALPEDTCHSVLHKHALAELDKYVRFPTGTTYSKQAVASAGPIAFDLVRCDIVDDEGQFSIEKAASAIHNMNDEDASHVEAALVSLGVEPTELPFDLALFR